MDMFQKLEKVLKRIHHTRKNNLFLIQFIFFFDVLSAQIDQRFDLYDWEIIRQNESVNSISKDINIFSLLPMQMVFKI